MIFKCSLHVFLLIQLVGTISSKVILFDASRKEKRFLDSLKKQIKSEFSGMLAKHIDPDPFLLGCYVEVPGSLMLGDVAVEDSSGPFNCASTCREEKKMTYMGMQNYKCYCAKDRSVFEVYGYASNQKICNPECYVKEAACSADPDLAPEIGNKMYTVCPLTRYGNSCHMSCFCAIQECEITTGVCFKPGCQTGFMGPRCDIAAKCDNKPCKNGAICKNEGEDYKCICKRGFEGKDCEIPIDEAVFKGGEGPLVLIKEPTTFSASLDAASPFYFGCYGDDDKMASIEATSDIPLDCVSDCRVKSFTFVAFQEGAACRCGNMNHFSKLISNSSNCPKECRPSTGLLCGRKGFRSIYTVCSMGFYKYGDICESQCRCADTIPCDIDTGICSNNKCQPLWGGERCNEPLEPPLLGVGNVTVGTAPLAGLYRLTPALIDLCLALYVGLLVFKTYLAYNLIIRLKKK